MVGITRSKIFFLASLASRFVMKASFHPIVELDGERLDNFNFIQLPSINLITQSSWKPETSAGTSGASSLK
jgi:hypothetical protein